MIIETLDRINNPIFTYIVRKLSDEGLLNLENVERKPIETDLF